MVDTHLVVVGFRETFAQNRARHKVQRIGVHFQEIAT